MQTDEEKLSSNLIKLTDQIKKLTDISDKINKRQEKEESAKTNPKSGSGGSSNLSPLDDFAKSLKTTAAQAGDYLKSGLMKAAKTIDAAFGNAGSAVGGFVAKIGIASIQLANRFDTLLKRSANLGASIPGIGLGKAVGAVGAPVKAIAGAAEAVASPFTAILSSIGPIISQIGSMVEKINPQIVQQVTLAFDDLQAVFGSILAPVLQAFTPIIRKLADTFLTMKPAIDPIIKVVTDIMMAFAELIEPLAQMVIPYINIFASVLRGVLIPAISLVVEGIKFMAKAFQFTYEAMISIFNKFANSWAGRRVGAKAISTGGFDDLDKKSATGLAIRQTSVVSAEQLGQSARQAAFGQAINWQQETAKNTATTNGLLQNVINLFSGNNDAMGGFFSKILGVTTSG